MTLKASLLRYKPLMKCSKQGYRGGPDERRPGHFYFCHKPVKTSRQGL